MKEQDKTPEEILGNTYYLSTQYRAQGNDHKMLNEPKRKIDEHREKFLKS